MFRYLLAVFAWCLSTAVAAAGGMSSHQQVIDFTQPDQAAKLATWSDPQHLGCTKEGFGWDGSDRSYRDAWIETEPLAIGTSWRPTQNAGIRITIQTNNPAIVVTGPDSKAFHTPGIFVRHSADRVHWSDWQPTDMNEDRRMPGTVLYTTRVGVPRRTIETYHAKLREWSRRDDIEWGSDEDEFCRWLVNQEPDYFSKERPFVGYVQFLLETSFNGSQRLTHFEADVSWSVGGIHQPPHISCGRKTSAGSKCVEFSRRGSGASPKRLTTALEPTALLAATERPSNDGPQCRPLKVCSRNAASFTSTDVISVCRADVYGGL